MRSLADVLSMYMERPPIPFDDEALAHMMNEVMQTKEFITTHNEPSGGTKRTPASEVAPTNAEAWDKGYVRGRADHCDCSPIEECDVTSPNPYRADRIEADA